MDKQTRSALCAANIVAFLLVLVCMTPFPGYATPPKNIPDILKPWESWVLHGKDQYSCPRSYSDAGEFMCVWPEMLDLDVGDKNGQFKQKITVFTDGYIPLPGDSTYFPLTVTVDGKEEPILSRNNQPQVYLTKGTHTLTGRFSWETIPTFFPLPDHTALVSLRVNGELQASPSLDLENRLWISPPAQRESADESQSMDSLRVSVCRLIEDGHPMTLTTRLSLWVSGKKRREKINFSLPDKANVTGLSSPLTARLMEDNSLLVDVKAGTWSLTVSSVINGRVASLGPVQATHGEEIWSFKPDPHVRMAHVDKVVPIDPMQTDIPEPWKRYSAYRVTEGDEIVFVETQRGCSDEEIDKIGLVRDLWLDFDGNGATILDTLTGSLGRRRVLFLDDQHYQLGRITLNEKDRLISRSGHFNQGLELDRGPLNLRAVSRIPVMTSGNTFSLGWNSDYQSADMTLHLPPGWRIWAVGGGQAEKNSTWLNRWSMLDLLLILVTAYVAFRLWNIAWCLIFLSGMILICQEPLSPFFMWAVLIFFTALVRFKLEPQVTWPKTVKAVNVLFLAVLTGLSLVFCLSQVKTTVYPQLESLGRDKITLNVFRGCSHKLESLQAPIMLSEEMAMEMDDEIMAKDARAPMKKKESLPEQTFRVSPEHLATQTGPALPQWTWKDIPITLGEVPSSHMMRFWLESPTQNAFLSVVRVLLVILMLGRIIPFRFPDRTRYRSKHQSGTLLTGIILAGIFCFTPARSFGDIPSPALLDELEKRLTQPDACFPDCATLTEVDLTLPDEPSDNGKSFIKINVTVNAAIETAIPLPSGRTTWSVYDMTLDNRSHMSLTRKAGLFWTIVPQGRHHLSVRGIAGTGNRLLVTFPMKPALIRVTGPGWDISGLDENRQTEHTLIATQKMKSDPKPNDDSQGPSEKLLADVVTVERILSLDREWTVVTSVERFPGTDTRKSVVVHLPLLKNEKIRTDIPNLDVSGNVAQVSLIPGNLSLSWISSLPITPSLDLSVPQNADWIETWKLELSSLWSLSAQGPPRICKDDSPASLWFPWPGEQAHLTITRLAPAEGDFFTMDSASVDYHVEKGSNRLILQATARSSQGRTLHVPTPEGCIVKSVRVNHRSLPFSGKPEAVDLTLSPGHQSIFIEWDQAETWQASWLERYIKPAAISFPVIDLGQSVSNITMRMHLPNQSWVVFTHGPVFGPALTSWGLCIVILILAPFLARLPLSPLRTRTWAILGIGLVSLSIPQVLMVAAWFFIVELRKDKSLVSPFLFNVTQLILMAWTVWFVAMIFTAVSQGLLHVPNMRIAGNGSSDHLLIWTQDRVAGALPRPWISMYSAQTYHFLMLIWSLWIAAHVLPWSKFALSALSTDGLFRAFHFNRGKRRIT